MGHCFGDALWYNNSVQLKLIVMEWTAAIISNIATIAIAFLGVAFTVLFYKLDKRNIANKKSINKLANQVKAYYELEQLYAQELENYGYGAKKTILQKYRTQVKINNPDIDFSGSWITSNTADKYLS